MRLFSFLLIGLLSAAPLSATWSIIAVDRETGRVVIASATCAATGPDQLKLLQAVVAPGVGVAAAQAGVDRTHENQRLIFQELQGGTEPAAIIQLLQEDPEIERRQFGIVDLEGRVAGRTGAENRDAAMDTQGVARDGIVYSVQGNIMANDETMIEAARVMRESSEPITDRVMAAMERADELGGDGRCTCETEPLPEGAMCTGKTSHVAYILAADPDDALGPDTGNPPDDLTAPYNSGDYHLYIAIWPDNTEPHEDANPVRTLRMRYDEWRAGR